MAKLGINTGTTANDGTGDTLREAGGKINTNFDEIYSSLGDGTNIFSGIVTSIVGGDFVSVSSPTGEVTITGLANTENINSESLVVVGVSTLGVVTSTESMGIGTIYTPRVECSGAVIGGTLVGDGSQITGLATTERVSSVSLVVSGISTLGIVTGVPSIQSTEVYATNLYGDGANINNIQYSAVAGLATDATFAGYSETSGIATYASSSGVSTFSGLSGIATFATTAGLATDATFAGFAEISGISTLSTHSITAGISSFTGSWVIGAGGTSNYTFTGNGFTGIETNPILYLTRGQVYRFTNQLGVHPFQIQETPNGSVGSAYTIGITNNGVVNGDLIFDVHFDAPKHLYYQCTAHNVMGGVIEILNNYVDFAEYSDVSGIATYATNSGIATYATTAGLATDATFAGYSVVSGFSTTSGLSTISTYAETAGISTNSTFSSYSPLAGIATYATTAGLATDATFAGYSEIAGIATYSTTSGIATYATISGISTVATNAQGLTGIPDIEIGKLDVDCIEANELITTGISTLGIVTGATYYGDGTNITGVVPVRSVQVFQNLEILGVSTLGIVTSVQSLSSDQIYATNIDATTVSGDGSGLTNVTASKSVGLKLDDVVVGSGFTTIDFRYEGEIEAQFSGTGTTAIYTVTGLAATANTRTDSLVVAGVSTLGIVTGVTSIEAVDIYTNSITASQISGNSDSSDSVLAVTDTTSTTGRRVSFINDADTGVSNHETVNVGDLIWTPSTGNLSGVTTYTGQSVIVTGNVDATTYTGQDITATGNVTANSFIGDGSNLTGVQAGVGTADSINTTGIITATAFLGDGSGLTGVIGSGSGTIIEDGGTVVGTAGTIDFGDHLSVSTLANGRVTISGIGTFSGDYNDLANQPTVPTNNNQLTNGAGFITTSFTNTNQLTNDAGFITTSFTNTNQLTNGAGFITNAVDGTLTATSYIGDGSNMTSGQWTLGAVGSNHYTFTGVGFTEATNDPDIYLARGRLYVFVNEMGIHPFQIQETPNGTIGTPYDNGVVGNGQTNGGVSFTVPFNAPDTLYYQCASHTGMGGTIFIYPTLR